LAYDQQALYIAAEVTDDVTGPAQPPATLWLTDSVQLALDADNDRTTGYVSSGFADLFPATGFGADYVLLDPGGTIPGAGPLPTLWGTSDLPGGLYKYVSADPVRWNGWPSRSIRSIRCASQATKSAPNAAAPTRT